MAGADQPEICCFLNKMLAQSHRTQKPYVKYEQVIFPLIKRCYPFVQVENKEV